MSKELQPWAAGDLARSGISPEAAAAAGMYAVQQERYEELLGFTLKDMPDGYAIPFLDPVTGQPMLAPDGRPFVRVKFSRPVTLGDSEAKYASPKEGGVHAYIIPAVLQADVAAPLVVTEGEKKALCACLNGIPTIGLVGVFGFFNSETKDLHADLHAFVTAGREIVFVVDSDAAINKDIATAAHRFSVCAKLRGCKFKALVLPPHFEGESGKRTIVKAGMDDVIVKDGAERMRSLLSQAEPVEGTADDLYVKWLCAYARLCNAEGADPASLADDIVRKGFFDKIPSATRRRVTAELSKIFPLLAAAVNARVRERLEEEFRDTAVPEHGGENLVVGRYARVPGYDQTLKIDALQDEVAWCFLPNSSHASRPFLRKHLELAPRDRGGTENGAQGGRPPAPTITVMANAFLAQESVNVDGVCTLRFLRGQWFKWNSMFYERIPEQDVRGMVMEFLRRHPLFSAFATTRTMTDVLNQLKAHDAAGMPSDVELPVWINDDGHICAKGWIAMTNGVVNVENMARAVNGEDLPESDIFRSLTPRLFTPFGLGYGFDTEAACPLFERYLVDVQPEVDAREIIQMLMGLCLVPDTSFNVFFVLHGRGGEGKSVFLYILVNLIGKANVAHVPFSKFSDKFSIGLLTENLVNVIGEGDTELPRDAGLGRIEGVLKDVCDGGLLPVEHKFQEPCQARATARCMAASNSLPTFYDRSEAIWDRLRVIPFNVRVRGTSKDDPKLRGKIVDTELSGIFNFAVAGLAKLRKLTRFPETPAGAAMKAEHRARCDHEREFLAEAYAEAPQDTVIATQEVYREYKNWMGTRNYHSLGDGNFAASVQRVFPNVRKGRPRSADGKQVHAWMGLKRIEEVA
ncbi:MAG: phage/plasmid primase, P4 family [bacterium]